MSTEPARYHPVLVGLHWLLALLIVLALLMGTFSLKEIANASPDKIEALRTHMIMGLAIGGLMLARLVTRLRTTLPALAPTGNALLDKLGHSVHIGLYLAVFAMAASGAATAFQAGLPDIVFGGNAQALPESFASLLPRAVHGWTAKLLAALFGLHLIGALFHQFVRKDRLLSRVWFGRR